MGHTWVVSECVGDHCDRFKGEEECRMKGCEEMREDMETAHAVADKDIWHRSGKAGEPRHLHWSRDQDWGNLILDDLDVGPMDL